MKFTTSSSLFISWVVYIEWHTISLLRFLLATYIFLQVNEDQYNRVLSLIGKGKSEGAVVKCGGDKVGDEGYFVQPTVFSNVTDEMTIAKEEVNNLSFKISLLLLHSLSADESFTSKIFLYMSPPSYPENSIYYMENWLIHFPRGFHVTFLKVFSSKIPFTMSLTL